MKSGEEAGEEANEVSETRVQAQVQEGETPRGPEEAAETPDAEKSYSVLPPLIPGADLSVDQEEHHKA